MSYLKSMATNKAKSQAYSDKEKVVHVGGIDLLMCSAPPGNGSPPLFQQLKKEQVSSDSAIVWIKFTKDTKMPGEARGWAWTFDGEVWHQIDNYGTVRSPFFFSLAPMRRVFPVFPASFARDEHMSAH